MSTFDQLLLLVSGLGGLHGLFLATYLLFRRPGAWSNRFLAALIFVLSLRVLKSVLFYFNPAIGKQILQLGLSACFLIGPLLFCYTLQFLGIFRQSWLHRLHWMIPLFLLLVVGSMYPYHAHPELWGKPFFKIITYVWLAYILLAIAVLRPTISRLMLQNWRQNWRQEIDALIVIAIVLGCGLIWCAYYFSSYTSYISGALVFTFLMLIGILSAVFHVQQDKKIATPYADKKIASDTALALIAELEQLMLTQKVYLDANLAMPKLAKMLAWSTPKLSQLLNDNLQKTFNDYINGYRIEYAKALLISADAMKMEDLAERAGFNSLSTFYAVFKKHTQLTPAKYKSLHQ